MITDAWMERYQERMQRGIRAWESGDAVAVRSVVWRLEDAHASGDIRGAARYLTHRMIKQFMAKFNVYWRNAVDEEG